MQTYLKTKPVWVQLLLFVGMAFGILSVIMLAGGMLLSQLSGVSIMELANPEGWNPSDPGIVFLLRGSMLLQFLGLFLIPSLLFAYFSDPHPLAYIGLKRPVHAGYWIMGVLALLAAIPLVEYLGLLNRQVGFSPGTRQWIEEMEAQAARTLQVVLGRNTPTDLILNLIFIALFAGIGEELFFRGVIQRLLIRSTGRPWVGILLTAAVFSFFHFQFLGFLPRFFLGVLLGTVYWYSGSLWTAILAHFLYDAVIVAVLYAYPQYADSKTGFLPPDVLPWIALGSALLVGLCIWWMQRSSTIRYEAVYAGDRPPLSDDSFTD